MRDIVSGARAYALELPAVLGAGAVGRVAALGPDATRLKLGDWVLCDPTLRSRDDPRTPDIALQGLVARGPGGTVLQRRYRNGAFAERMLTPLENLQPARRHRRRRGGALVRRRDDARCPMAACSPSTSAPAKSSPSAARPAISAARRSCWRSAWARARSIACGRNAEALARLERRFGAARARRRLHRRRRGRLRAHQSRRARRRSTPCSTSCRRRRDPAATRAAILSLARIRPRGADGRAGLRARAALQLVDAQQRHDARPVDVSAPRQCEPDRAGARGTGRSRRFRHRRLPARRRRGGARPRRRQRRRLQDDGAAAAESSRDCRPISHKAAAPAISPRGRFDAGTSVAR